MNRKVNSKAILICSALYAASLVGANVVYAAETSVTPTPVQESKAKEPVKPLGFFVTSEGVGKGADLGGLAGADAYCQKLATVVGAGGKTWHAYLSTQASDGQVAVNARDRIGKGPWYNVKGTAVAKDVANLHGDTLDVARLGNNLS